MCKWGNKKDLCLGIPLTQRKVLARQWLFFFAASKSLKVPYSNFLSFSLSFFELIFGLFYTSILFLSDLELVNSNIKPMFLYIMLGQANTIHKYF